VAPALDLGLVAVLREALEIFDGQLFGGRALLRELLADERVSGHAPLKRGLSPAGNLHPDDGSRFGGFFLTIATFFPRLK
jgi:hypothetical protein